MMPTVLNKSHKEKAKLYVVTSITNSRRYHSRYNLYNNFKNITSNFDCKLVTIEAAFGDREFGVVQQEDAFNIQLRTNSELWHKENLLNIAVSRLPQDWEYVAFVDADVQFARPDWVDETMHQLQHHPVVQMFSEAQDLGPDYSADHFSIKKHMGFAYCFLNNIQPKELLTAKNMYFSMKTSEIGTYWHPGFAWAWTRDAYNKMGGLLDSAILGAGDNHMAYSLVGKAEKTFYKKIHPSYNKPILTWQDRCNKYIKENIGYVSGLMLHYWHGKKINRGYTNRWKLLVNNAFDLDKDIYKDWQGLWAFTDNNPKLAYEIQKYFKARNEDGIDL